MESKSHRFWHILKMLCAHQTPKISFLPPPWFNNSIKCLLALPSAGALAQASPLHIRETLQNTKTMGRSQEELEKN